MTDAVTLTNGVAASVTLKCTKVSKAVMMDMAMHSPLTPPGSGTFEPIMLPTGKGQTSIVVDGWAVDDDMDDLFTYARTWHEDSPITLSWGDFPDVEVVFMGLRATTTAQATTGVWTYQLVMRTASDLA